MTFMWIPIEASFIKTTLEFATNKRFQIADFIVSKPHRTTVIRRAGSLLAFKTWNVERKQGTSNTDNPTRNSVVRGRCLGYLIRYQESATGSPELISYFQFKMGNGVMGFGRILLMVVGVLLVIGEGVLGIRFVIDREECLSHKVEYEGDTVHASFVVIKTDSPWNYDADGVDLVITGPSGEQIHDFRGKTTEKYEFMAQKRGIYRFCFTNKSPYHETVDFDVHVGHFAYYDQHAKDEHFTPLLEQISKLEEALYNIQFEQHWLEAQTDRQAIVNEGMSSRAIHKALFESAALVGASVLQVYLLQRLFERKLGMSRV